MRVIIAGSRTITDPRFVGYAFDRFLNKLYSLRPRPRDDEVTEIVSGGARGPDQIGEAIALALGLPYTQFTPDWDTHGKAAGHIRNREMAAYACEESPGGLIACWDGKSSGTRGMIEAAKKRGMAGLVLIPNGPWGKSEYQGQGFGW